MSTAKGRQERQVQIDTSEMNVLFVHSALDDYPLTPEEFRLYGHIARRASSGAAYPSIENMAKACRMHPDTVRRCLGNLVTYKLLEAHERKGRTTLYTLTKFSRWVKPEVVLAIQAKQEAEGKAKRAEKKARKQQAQTNPPETEGGVRQEDETATPPKRREGYPSEMEGGDPPETKGDEGNPLRESIEGSGVLDVVGDPREDAQPAAAPVAEPSPDPRTTFSASPSTDEAMPLTPALGTLITSPAVVPGVAVLEPPVGGAADAAEDEDAISLEEFEGLLERGKGQATDTENVPGGGAAGAAPAVEAPRGALLPPVALGVAHLAPVPRDELLSRPVASLDSEQMRTIRTMVTGKLIRDGLLDQLTPTGGLSREDWLRLTLEELDLVKRAAQADAKAKIGGFTTRVIDGLDRMIGGGQQAKAQPAGVHGGGALAPAKKPEVDTTPEEGRYRVGACWRCKKTGREVSIVGTVEVRSRNGVGARYVLSDEQQLPALNLVLGYEFVGSA
ncbi:helix-turn-helix domain-containing protein [Deinococcus sp. NW-56]|uniref:helix-turn-helix domain-containing protein n=1 Tax=Deinococcus sp. NW-56 TaxID=2080419 RepID=UPI000CF3B821|nr:helix-turn-helix domain-containing protein [Deinococcus sp. NW-56]